MQAWGKGLGVYTFVSAHQPCATARDLRSLTEHVRRVPESQETLSKECSESDLECHDSRIAG